MNMLRDSLIFCSTIHYMASIGDLREIKQLLGRGEDINSRLDFVPDRGSFMRQLTPLMIAAGSIDATVETLKFLIENGANTSAKSAGNVTAAWYAASHGGNSHFFKNDECINQEYANKLLYLLEQGLDPWECSKNGRSLISNACRSGNIYCINLLIKKGVEPISSQYIQELYPFQIPLFCAVESNSLPCLKTIIDREIDINIKDRLNRNALFYASNLEIIKTLIGNGINLNLVDTYGDDILQSILTESISENTKIEICQYLVKCGLSIDYFISDKFSRLTSLAYNLETDNIKLLLSIGANPYLVGEDRRTPLHASCWEYDGLPEFQGKNQKMKELIELFIKTGININSLDIHENTPLHIAVTGNGGSATAISTLIGHGADPNITNNDGATSLMLASSEAELECIQVLLNSGASDKIKDKQGNNAIDYAYDYYIHLINEKHPFLGNYNSRKNALKRVKDCLKYLKSF
jgi:ankyrin repeat protein